MKVQLETHSGILRDLASRPSTFGARIEKVVGPVQPQ